MSAEWRARSAARWTRAQGDAGIDVGTAASERGCGREFAVGEDDGDGYDGAVDLRFVHVGDGGFGVGLVVVEDVGGAAVGHD